MAPNPFSLEEQARRAAEGLRPLRTRRGRKEARLVRAIAELDATEEKLARVTRRWLKQRALVRRLERELDREPAEELPAMLRRQAT